MNQVEVLRKQIQYYAYVFGAIILLFFGQMIGNNGIAYLAIAMETIGLFVVLIGEGAADVLGKMLRFRRKRQQFNEALILRKRINWLQVILTSVFFIAIFLLADVIAEMIFKIPNAALIIRVLAPVLLLRMLGTLLIGYFQGFGAHMPAVLSCLLRQVLFLILGRLFCEKFLAYGEKAAALLKNDDFYGMYGAVGLVLSMVVSELVILVALLIFYFISDRNYDKKRSEEGLHKAEALKDTIMGFFSLGSKNMSFSFFKRLFVLIALIFLVQLDDIGVFYGKYLLLCAIPTLLVGARFYMLYARLISVVRNKNGRQIRERIQVGFQYAWSTGILITVLIAVLAPQLVSACFAEDILLQKMLQHGSMLVLAVILIAYMILVHMAHNRQMVCLLTLLGSTVLFVILGIVLGNKIESRPMAIIYAAMIALYVEVLVLGAFTVSMYRLQLEYVSVFVLPLVCVGIVGVVVLLLCKFLTPHIGNEVAFVLGILLGVVLYLVCLGFSRVFSETEIEQLYGKVGKKVLSVIFK